MKSLLSVTIGSALFCVIGVVQAAELKFETASVKRADRCSMQNSVDPGMVTLRGDPLKVVLMEAFKVKTDEIVGPSWLDTECYEITAKMPKGATREQLPAMLQDLLVTRFKLVARKEARPRSAYALVVDKNGPKVHASEPDSNLGMPVGQRMFRSGAGVAGVKGSMTMEALARYLSGKGYGPVQDATGLEGKYDVDLSWAPDPSFEQVGHPNSDGSNTAAAGLLTAVRESLGLRLEPRKLSVEVLVVESAERAPTEN